jgi:deoxyadenosine/deoxycytidine kinase
MKSETQSAHAESEGSKQKPTIIAIEGCVGAGKTTLAEGLAALRGTRLLLEDFSAVPFLEEFYRDPIGCALETEFAFMLQHYHQLRLAGRQGGEIIADFTFIKDVLFAQLNMADEDERSLFLKLFHLLEARLPSVALTVFISASDELILHRIRERGRSIELATDPAYYRRLNSGYEAFFAEYSGETLQIRADEYDFLADPTLFGWLSKEIDQRLAAQVA